LSRNAAKTDPSVVGRGFTIFFNLNYFKNMKKLVLAIALLAFGATASFAQNEPAAKANEKAKQHANHNGMGSKAKKGKKAAKAEKMVYECPMKCEPASDKPGKCGKCGMDLKAKKA
jgi:hypothetical protein